MKKLALVLVAVLAMTSAAHATAVLDVDWTSSDVYAAPGDTVTVGLVLAGLGGYPTQGGVQVTDTLVYWDVGSDIDLMVPVYDNALPSVGIDNIFYTGMWDEGDLSGTSDPWWGDTTNPSMMDEYNDGFNVGKAWYRSDAASTPDGFWWGGDYTPVIGDLLVEWDIMISATATPGNSVGVQVDFSFDQIDWVGYDGYNPTVPAGNAVGDKWYDVIKTGDAGALTVHIVPEPVTMSVLALGGLALLKRRK